MNRARSRIALVLVLALGSAAPIGGTAEAKKGGKVATETVANVPIAPSPEPGVPTPTDVRFEIGKKFKGRVVDSVELTTQITSETDDWLANVSAGGARLISPQGRAVSVVGAPFDFSGNYDNRSFGPMTQRANDRHQLCQFQPCGENFFEPLGPPWAGTIGRPTLVRFFGVRMRGTWILEINNVGFLPENGVLTQATLKIKPAKPEASEGAGK